MNDNRSSKHKRSRINDTHKTESEKQFDGSDTRQESERQKHVSVNEANLEVIDFDKSYYIALTGGLCDNIRIYCLCYYYPNLKVTFVCNDLKQYEIGQKNTNLLKFNCKRIVEKSTLPPGTKIHKLTTRQRNLYIPGFDTSYSFVKMFRGKIRQLLLHPIQPYSNYCSKIVNKIWKTNDYLLIGIRWRFPYSIRNHFFLYDCDKLFDSIEQSLTNYDNVILMFDDWNYLPLFVSIFRDLLKDKRIIVLNKIGPNDVPDLIRIGYTCIRHNKHKRTKKNFVHNFSGFYLLLELISE